MSANDRRPRAVRFACLLTAALVFLGLWAVPGCGNKQTTPETVKSDPERRMPK